MVEAKFVIAVKKIEDGLYEVRYPDFPGLVSMVDSPERIKSVCGKMLNIHLNEIKEADKELVYPVTYDEAVKFKKPGVELDLVAIAIPEGLKMTERKEPVSGKEKIEETAKAVGETVNKVFKKLDNIEKLEKINNLGSLPFVTGILFILSVFLPLASAKDFFAGGTQYMGLFLSIKGDVGMPFYTFKAIMAFMYVLVICSGVFSLYTGTLKSKFYTKAADIISILLFFVFMLVFDVEMGRYFPVAGVAVGKSYMFLVLFIGALIAAFDLALILARGDE